MALICSTTLYNASDGAVISLAALSSALAAVF
jgi:hypothetical protein